MRRASCRSPDLACHAPNEDRDGPIAGYLATLEALLKARVREAVRVAYRDGEPDGPRSYAATAWAVKGTAP